ncbi:MAG: hypothetical protein P8Z71_06795 [Candidatus Sulfobium sp.]
MAVLALLVLLSDLVIRRKETIGLFTMICVAIVTYSLAGSFGVTFKGMFIADGYSLFFKLIFLLNVVLTVLISVRYIEIEKVNLGEYYALLLFALRRLDGVRTDGDHEP